jgi:AcrR family transcriptional regulator
MPRRNLTSSAVIELAAEIADAEGFDAVSVSAVARAAGVQPASLYGHVRDREALLDGMQRLALDELATRIGDAVAGRSGRDALDALAVAHRTYAHDAPGRWATMQRPASADTAASPGAERVATLTLAVLRGYGLGEDAAVHATRLVAATITGFVALDAADAFAHRPTATEDSWSAAIDALDRALRTWP